MDRKLDAVAFSHPAIVLQSESFERILINCTKPGLLKGLARKYKVRGFPTVLFLGPDGKTIKTMCSRQPKVLLSHMKEVLEKLNPGKDLAKLLSVQRGLPWKVLKRISEALQGTDSLKQKALIDFSKISGTYQKALERWSLSKSKKRLSSINRLLSEERPSKTMLSLLEKDKTSLWLKERFEELGANDNVVQKKAEKSLLDFQRSLALLERIAEYPGSDSSGKSSAH